ncbi:MAG: hypothetical protein HQK54_00355 [Oligoflexales bacterium]|nr:hypothetical protein [Oligoflexales bacterium]
MSFGFRGKAALFIVFSVFNAERAISVVKPAPSPVLEFVRDPSELKTSISIPFSEIVEKVEVPVSLLKTRATKGQPEAQIESLSLQLPKEEEKLGQFAKRFAKPGKAAELEEVFLEKLRSAGPSDKDSVKVYLTDQDFNLMNPEELSTEYAKEHHSVMVTGSYLKKNRAAAREFISQINGFLTKKDLGKVMKKIRTGADLSLDKDLLPPFPKRMVKKFLVYRGPNCFHAALSFHDQELAKSKYINVKEESGYHPAMINYDELWRVLDNRFYEVNVKKYPLKYGDMIVFFNIPDNLPNNLSFRWIRHTATYLFGPYTFSKGSKSPDTPYSIKTISEEWNTWLSYTTNLGVKVYRKKTGVIPKGPMFDPTDWIY